MRDDELREFRSFNFSVSSWEGVGLQFVYGKISLLIFDVLVEVGENLDQRLFGVFSESTNFLDALVFTHDKTLPVKHNVFLELKAVF